MPKSIIDIEVNDEQFKKFLELYDGFQTKLADVPEDWAKVDKASHAAFNAIGAAMLAQNALLAKSLKGQQDFTDETGHAATAWEKLSRHTKDAASNIVGAAKSLASWTGAATIVSGLIGVGSLFGIDRLGMAVSAGRRSAAGLGVSYGQQQSFGLNFGRFVDPGAVLGSVSTGLFDVTSPEYMALLRAGISPQMLAKGNAADIGAELLAKIPKQFGNVPANQRGMLANVLGYSQLGIGAEEINRYLSASPAERAQQQKAYRADQQGLGLSKEQQGAWNDLTTQLTRAGKMIENTFVVGLSLLLPGIKDLSKGFSDAVTAFLGSDVVKQWMVDLGEGLKWLGEYFKSPGFKTDMEEFVKEVGEFVKAVGEAVKFVYGALNKQIYEKPVFDKDGKPVGLKPMIDLGGAIPPLPKSENQFPGIDKPMLFKGSYSRDAPGSGAPSDLLSRISYVESRGNPNAVSPKGAMGEFQFMPGTWKEFGAGGDPFNAQDSRAAGGRYLTHLLQEFHGDMREAVAAYNWGPGNIEKDVKEHGEQWERYLPNETKDYLTKVLGGAPSARDQAPRPRPSITVNNNTGGSAILSASQIAV